MPTRQPADPIDLVRTRRVAAVIFDFDGIILDSETAEFEAHRQIFERWGASLTPEEWCGQIGTWVEGHGGRWFRRLCELSPNPPGEEQFEAEKRLLCGELLARTPMPGIVALLDRLGAADVPVAVASTSPARWVVPAAEQIGLRNRFDAIVTADDVERRKPAPDVYIEAMRRLGVVASRSVAIEDSAPGIAAARAAGMKTIAIPHWLTERHDLSIADLRVTHAGDVTIDVLETLVDEPLLIE